MNHHSRHCVVGFVNRRCGSNKLLPSRRPLSSLSSSSFIFKHDDDNDPTAEKKYHVRRELLRTYHTMPHMQSKCINEVLSTGSRRYFSSSISSSSIDSKSNNTNSRRRIIYHYYGNNNNLLQFSKLKPRQSAEIEDELYTRLLNYNINNKHDDDDVDNRLLDPILQRSICRGGLDWLKSISVPSSSSLVVSLSSNNQHDNDDNNNKEVEEEKDSIIVTIEPPTLLHPKLYELASNVANVVQEEVVSLLTETTLKNQQNQLYATTWLKQQQSEEVIETHQVGVTIVFSPKSTCSPYQSTGATTSHQSTFKSFTTNNNNNNQQQQSSSQSKALQNITHFLAVYSCKGGVGKSTIATNLAYQLSAMGGRVGLLDVDVYGPSLPLLVKPADATVRQSPSDSSSDSNTSETTTSTTMVEPIIHNNVKLMSLGYVSPNSGVPGSGPNSGAAVLRGPMAGRVVSQLLKGTNWGNLDVLVLDLPPGTGDVQLTICQSLQLSGALAISTPSKLAWSDVTKGVEMFGELNVRTLGVVENMSYFECEGGGRHYPFGKTKYYSGDAGEEESAENSSSLTNHYLPASSHVFHLPISSKMNDANDSGTPLCCIDDTVSIATSDDGNNTTNVLEGEGEEERATFAKIAKAISTDLLLLQHNQTPLSMKNNSQHITGGKSVLTVSITTEAEDGEEGTPLEFDVPLTQLSVDNDERNFTVRLFSNEGGYQKVISGRELKCRDPRTGDVDDTTTLAEGSSETAKQHKGGGCGSGKHHSHASTGQSSSSMVQQYTSGSSTKQKDTLFPVNVTKKGSYGYEIEWADGSKIIYSLLAIAKAAGGKALK